MAVTLKQFMSQLDESGVFSAADAVAFQETQTLPSETAEDFAKLLVKHKKLTKFQAQMIYQGKGERLLLGSYVILSEIGAGGMGQVYLAEHRRMKRQVALKTLPTAMTQDEQAIQRFHREVQAAAKLTHPNIVTAFDADEAKGIHYFAMEYVQGIDLADLVKKQGVPKVDAAVDYILQAAKGLEYAHSEGIVHRDIKPANLLLDNKGTIKILDMGLARIDNDENPATQLTQSGSVMGTVDYMAPEQAQDTHTADARSDIYSLGCSLYYLLTGQSVYSGDTLVNRIMAHQNKPIPSLTAKHDHIPQELDALFQKMVAKEPVDRYQSMAEVISAIESCGVLEATSSSSAASSELSDMALAEFLQIQKATSTPTVLMTEKKPLLDTQKETLVSGFLDNTLIGGILKTQKKSLKTIGKRTWVATGVVLASVLLLAGIFLTVDTPAGTIVLEIDQPELAGAVVTVDDQKKITIKTGEGKEPIVVVVDKKTHTLKVTKGGFETFTKQFTVKAGGKEIIRVRLEPLAVAKKNPPSAGSTVSQNYALEFDGKSSYVESPTLKYDGSHPVTIESFVLPTDTYPIRDNSDLIAGWSRKIVVAWGENETLRSPKVMAGTNLLNIRSLGILKKKKLSPAHLAGVWDGRAITLFVNGRKACVSFPFSHFEKTSGSPETYFAIGAGQLNKKLFRNFFQGLIDEVRISNTVRYTKDFTPAKRFETDEHTIALYHFDEATGDVLKDSSGNFHHGKIVGAKWVKVDDQLKVIGTPIPSTPVPGATAGLPSSAANDPQRRAAEMVLRRGGTVSVLTSTTKKTIAQLDQLPKERFALYSVVLTNNQSLSEADWKAFQGIKYLAALTFSNTPISDAGCKQLKAIGNIYSLNINNCRLTDAGVRQLSELTHLVDLYLGDCPGITDTSCDALLKLTELRVLDLYWHINHWCGAKKTFSITQPDFTASFN